MDNLNEDLSKTVLSSNESHSAKSSCQASQIIDYMDPITYLSDNREAESQISRVTWDSSSTPFTMYYRLRQIIPCHPDLGEKYAKTEFWDLPNPFNVTYLELMKTKSLWENAFRYVVNRLRSNDGLVRHVNSSETGDIEISHPQRMAMSQDPTVKDQPYSRFKFQVYIAKRGYKLESNDKMFFCVTKCRTNSAGVHTDFSAEVFQCGCVANFFNNDAAVVNNLQQQPFFYS